MEFLIVTATAMEMRAVAAGLGAPGVSPDSTGSTVVLVRGVPARLAVCGVGPLAAAFCAGRLAGMGVLSAERCRGFLCFGIAGTYNAAVAPIGSVVLAGTEIWPEYGLADENGVDAEALGFPLSGNKADTAPPPVWNSIPLDPVSALNAMGLRNPKAGSGSVGNPPVATGPGITVAGCSGTPDRARALAERYGALTENMEGFALALAAHGARIPFAEIRAVSNIAGHRNRDAWDVPLALAALSRAVSLIFPL